MRLHRILIRFKELNRLINRLPFFAVRLGAVVAIFAVLGWVKFRLGLGWLLTGLLYLVLAGGFILWVCYCTEHGKKTIAGLKAHARLMRDKNDLMKRIKEEENVHESKEGA